MLDTSHHKYEDTYTLLSTKVQSMSFKSKTAIFKTAIITEYLKKAFQVQGVASRRDFILAMLFNIGAFILLAVASYAIILTDKSLVLLAYMPDVFWLVMLIPSMTMLIRRIRDTGNSLWWFTVYLIPVVGVIVIFTIALMPGKNTFSR